MKGQCMCGAVTITAEPARQSLSVCHCDMCRRWGSGMFMALETREETVEITGPVRVFQSSDRAERAFCETCGSNLWYRITAPGPGHGQRHLSAGLFDVTGMRLGLELFIDAKPDAYAFEGDRKTMTAQQCFKMYAPKDEGDFQ